MNVDSFVLRVALLFGKVYQGMSAIRQKSTELLKTGSHDNVTIVSRSDHNQFDVLVQLVLGRQSLIPISNTTDDNWIRTQF